MGQIHMMSAT